MHPASATAVARAAKYTKPGRRGGCPTGAKRRPGPIESSVDTRAPSREKTRVRSEGEKVPFPIFGTLYAKPGLVRIGRKDSKSTVLCLERRTTKGRDTPAKLGYPSPVAWEATPPA